MSKTRAWPQIDWEFFVVRLPARRPAPGHPLARWKWRHLDAAGWVESPVSFPGFGECLLDAKRNGFVPAALPRDKTVLDLIRSGDVDGLDRFSQLLQTWKHPFSE